LIELTACERWRTGEAVVSGYDSRLPIRRLTIELQELEAELVA
jgi:hypothetical protein